MFYVTYPRFYELNKTQCTFQGYNMDPSFQVVNDILGHGNISGNYGSL